MARRTSPSRLVLRLEIFVEAAGRSGRSGVWRRALATKTVLREERHSRPKHFAARRAPEADMEALTPCTRCSRHTRSSESDCPFCGTALAARAAPATSARRSARLTRAAIFAGVAMIAPACGGASANDPHDTVSPHPPDETADEEAARLAARDAEQRRLEEEAQSNDDGNIQARPYGAPPRRDDYV